MDLTITAETKQFHKWVDEYTKALPRDVQPTALRALALSFVGKVIKHTPVDTGRARSGWLAYAEHASEQFDVGGADTPEANAARAKGESEGAFGEDFRGKDQYVEVINGVPYICVRSRTRIKTENGKRFASAVRVGDRLLTQAGVYKPVTRVFRTEVPEGTPMVRLRSKWRKDREHVLELTPHHKVMVRRNGINKWAEAWTVQETDQLFHHRKVSPRAGTAQMAECAECGKEYRKVRGWRFCSRDCRWAHCRRPGNNWHEGQKRSAACRERMSVSRRKVLAKNPDLHPNRLAAQRPTSCEVAVAEFLDTCGVEYERGKRIGKYWPDFVLPKERTVIEADGGWWHQNQGVDVARDKALLDILGDGWRITHIHFVGKGSPRLDPEPLPDVHYVAVNPGPASYVDPATFEATDVVGVEHFTVKCGKRGPRTWTLYDFEVDGIHSYYANGVLVSNSVLEFGSSQQNPTGMVRVAFREMQGTADDVFLKELEKANKKATRKSRGIRG